MLAKLPLRRPDRHGRGEFGAPRKNKTHRGIDLACYPGTGISALFEGEVTKLGYPYGDDLSFRYVQVTKYSSFFIGHTIDPPDPGAQTRVDWRYFYVVPCVAVGELIKKGQIIGFAQELRNRYEGITPHVHVELREDGVYKDPTPAIFQDQETQEQL